MDNQISRLCALLKLRSSDMLQLHHQVAGKGFFEAHPLLAEWYEKLNDDTDAICEIAVRLGLYEPTMKDAVLMYDSLPSQPYSVKEAYANAQRIMQEVSNAMAVEASPDIVNRLQEMQYELLQISDYMIKNALVD